MDELREDLQVYMCIPVFVDDTMIVTSNVPDESGANDVWTITTNAQTDEIVLDRRTNKLWKSVQDNNVGNDPELDDGTWWTLLGASNRFRAFDLRLGQQSENQGTLEYTILLSDFVDSVGFFRLEAGTVQVQVLDDTDAVVYDQTRSVTDASHLDDWWEYFHGVPDYLPTVIFGQVPGRLGYKVRVVIDNASGVAKVGQIAIAKARRLGQVRPGTKPQVQDFSSKPRDILGNVILTKRDFAETVDFEVSVETGDVGQLMRLMSKHLSEPLFYYTSADGQFDDPDFATTVFGFHNEPSPPMAYRLSRLSFTVEALT